MKIFVGCLNSQRVADFESVVVEPEKFVEVGREFCARREVCGVIGQSGDVACLVVARQAGFADKVDGREVGRQLRHVGSDLGRLISENLSCFPPSMEVL